MRCLCVTGIGRLRPGRSLKSSIGVSFSVCIKIADQEVLIYSYTGIEITDKGLSGEDEEDEDLTLRRRKRAKAENNVVPAWQNSQELAR